MDTKEDAIARFTCYTISALIMSTGVGLNWGVGAAMIVFGAVLMLWSILVDISLIRRKP